MGTIASHMNHPSASLQKTHEVAAVLFDEATF